MAIKFSQFITQTSASSLSHIVGYNGADNIQITPADFFTSFAVGSAGQVSFFDTTSSLAGSNQFVWDNTNKRLGIGTINPNRTLHIATDSGVLIKGASGFVNAKISLLPASGGRQYDLGNVGSDFRIFDASAGVTRMYFDNDGNTGIGTTTPSSTLQVSGTLDATGISQLGSSGANVYLTSSSAGNVGIGTSAPAVKLHVEGGNSYTPIRFDGSGNYQGYLYNDGGGIGLKDSAGTNIGNLIYIHTAANNIRLFTNGSEKMRVDSDGVVSIGTTSPSSNTNYGTGDLNVENDLFASAQIMSHNSTQGNYSFLGLGKSSGTGASPTIVQANEIVGTINYYGYDGSAYKPLARVGASVDGTPGAGVMPGRLEFWTTSTSSSTSPIKRMVIDNNGKVGIGTTSPVTKLHVNGDQLIFGDLLLEGSANSFRTVSMNTVDGSDNQSLYLCGGATASTARGGYVKVEGNEVSSAGGTVKIAAGNVSTGDIDFLTANTQRMIINNAGNVGIGTTSPDKKLTVVDDGAANGSQNITAQFSNQTSGATSSALYIGASAGADWLIGKNIYGVSSQSYFQIGNQAGTTPALTINHTTNNATFAGNITVSTAGATLNLLSETNGNSTINFADPADNNVGQIIYRHNGNSMAFDTNDVERMRINSDGLLFVGDTGTTYGYNSHHIARDYSQGYALIVRNSNTSTQNNSVLQLNQAETTSTTQGYFLIGRQGDPSSGTNRILIYSNGNVANVNNSYGAISDERLKENIVDATPKLDDLMKVKIRNYNFIGQENKQIGVIAQEIENVFPSLVEDTKDPESEETTKSVKYSVLVPIMLKAIQELKAEVEDLKSKI